MPADYRLWFDDSQAERQSRQSGESWRQARAFGGALQDPDLVSHREDLKLHVGTGPELDRRAAYRIGIRG